MVSRGCSQEESRGEGLCALGWGVWARGFLMQSLGVDGRLGAVSGSRDLVQTVPLAARGLGEGTPATAPLAGPELVC